MSEGTGRKRSLAVDTVTDAIRSMILSGELAPGDRIGQEELARRFEVSRIPVRGALARLESDGLVVLKPSSGAWVASFDLNECLEIYMIRERLEPLALRQAVPQMTEDRIAMLGNLAEAMAQTRDIEDFLHLDREFHLASYRDSGMLQLNAMIERFWNTTQHYRRTFTQFLGLDRNWIIHSEHRLMLDAITRRDAEGAAHILFEHIRRTRFELSRRSEALKP